ncbi:MAG: hypothetical protein DI629_03395 [Mesorhizobium amorphae]|nr:MAG: hypothetical protein DI629_03395 [Mesorhizobium amorphae]
MHFIKFDEVGAITRVGLVEDSIAEAALRGEGHTLFLDQPFTGITEEWRVDLDAVEPFVDQMEVVEAATALVRTGVVAPEVSDFDRDAARAAIDAAAERVRSLFITLGAGQAMVYQQKRAEAEMVMDAVDADAIPAADIPHLVAETARTGQTRVQASLTILAMANAWLQASVLIEERRLAVKEAVRAAATPQELAAATSVDWSDIAALA